MDMLLKAPRRGRRGVHLIDGGHVACPIAHRDVDVDQCQSCPALTEMHDAPRGELAYVVCRPGTASDLLVGWTELPSLR